MSVWEIGQSLGDALGVDLQILVSIVLQVVLTISREDILHACCSAPRHMAM